MGGGGFKIKRNGLNMSGSGLKMSVSGWEWMGVGGSTV